MMTVWAYCLRRTHLSEGGIRGLLHPELILLRMFSAFPWS